MSYGSYGYGSAATGSVYDFREEVESAELSGVTSGGLSPSTTPDSTVNLVSMSSGSIDTRISSATADAELSGLSVSPIDPTSDIESSTNLSGVSVQATDPTFVVDAVEAINYPDPLVFTASDEGTDLVSPSSQSSAQPAIKLKNQTDDTRYEVYFNWSSALDSCLVVGVSSSPSASISDTVTTSTTETKFAEIAPGKEIGVWIYADFSNCGYNTTFNNNWEINATEVTN